MPIAITTPPSPPFTMADNTNNTLLPPANNTSLPPAIAALLQSLFAAADPTTQTLINSALHASSPTNSPHPALQPFLTYNHIQAPITPDVTTLTPGSSVTSTIDDDNPKDNHILSQSNFVPRKPPPPQSPFRINSSAGITTTALKEQQAIQTADLQVQVHHTTKGHVNNINDTVKRKCVMVKLAIPSNANSDQAPTTAILEEVINAIISHLSFTFPINIVALFNYLVPVNNAKQTGSNYYSFAYLSPSSNQKHTTNIKNPTFPSPLRKGY
jgi:hypothetical protein